MHYYTHTHTRARAPRPANLFLFESARFLTCAARTTRTKYRDEERGGHGDRGRGGEGGGGTVRGLPEYLRRTVDLACIVSID